MALGPLAERQLGFDPRWLTLARAAVAALLLVLFWRRYVELTGAARLAARERWEAIAVGLAVFAAWISLDQGWMVVGDPVPGFVPLDRTGGSTFRSPPRASSHSLRWCR